MNDFSSAMKFSWAPCAQRGTFLQPILCLKSLLTIIVLSDLPTSADQRRKIVRRIKKTHLLLCYGVSI